jgi:hypothetical protein
MGIFEGMSTHHDDSFGRFYGPDDNKPVIPSFYVD